MCRSKYDREFIKNTGIQGLQCFFSSCAASRCRFFCYCKSICILMTFTIYIFLKFEQLNLVNNMLMIYSYSDIQGDLSGADINKRMSSKCQNVLALVDLVLSLSASSAICESVFSQVKLMKSSVRNRLSAVQMSRLLTIQFHSSDVKSFEPAPAIHHWNKTSSRARRPT